MNKKESALLQQLTGGAEPKFLLRTRSRIDAGRWWRSNPIWLCVSGDELILFAIARRRYVERVSLDLCKSSHYAPVTGEFVISPVETLEINHLSLTPREALDVLDFLN
jgi:hypothetical protein